MHWKNFLDKWSNWENWPMEMRYFLISPVWAWYCFRSGSLWFFTPSNPTLTFGGFEGESKKEMYEQLPPYSYPKTIYVHPDLPFDAVLHAIRQHQFSYPFIVKPDVGRAGILFRIVENEAYLKKYHQHIPAEYIIQELVTFQTEFSVFYYRCPNKDKGVITGFLRKELLEVAGDGKSTLSELVARHPKAKHRLAELKMRHEANWEKVVPLHQKFILSHAANLNRGGKFINLQHQIDEKLLRVFDDLNAYSKTFYYGRYDLKAASLEDLKEGKNFSILEYNGSGAEPNHVYNNKQTLFQAYAEILKHWKVLYQISRYNHKQGIRYWSFKRGFSFLKRAKKHIEQLKACDWI